MTGIVGVKFQCSADPFRLRSSRAPEANHVAGLEHWPKEAHARGSFRRFQRVEGLGWVPSRRISTRVVGVPQCVDSRQRRFLEPVWMHGVDDGLPPRVSRSLRFRQSLEDERHGVSALFPITGDFRAAGVELSIEGAANVAYFEMNGS